MTNGGSDLLGGGVAPTCSPRSRTARLQAAGTVTGADIGAAMKAMKASAGAARVRELVLARAQQS